MVQLRTNRFAELQPDLMEAVYILRPQPRRVRAQVDIHRRTVRADDLERKWMARLGQVFPGKTDEPREFLGWHFRGNACHQTRGFQLRRGLNHGVERVHGRHNQQLHGLALFLGNLDNVAEQLFLVIAEDLLIGEIVLAGAGRYRAHGHDDDVVTPQVRFLEDLLQMVHVVVIADGHQNASRSCVQARSVDLRLMLEIELLESFLLQMQCSTPAGGDVFRNCKQDEQRHSKSNAVDGRVLFRKQIRDGHHGENQSGNAKADGDLDAGDPDIERELVFLIVPLIAQREHAQRFQEEAPDHAKGVGLAKQISVAEAYAFGVVW